MRSCGDSFIESYLPIVKARKFEEFTEREKNSSLYEEEDMLSLIWFMIEAQHLD